MAFAFERDDLRQEVRRSTAGTVRIWAKVTGVGNVAASGSHSYTIYDSGGVVLQASSSASPTSVGGVSRFDLSIPAIATLQEDCRAELSWQYGGATYLSVAFFDVVLWPYGDVTLSLNDLQEERPELGVTLARMSSRLALSGAEEMASVFAYRARVELDGLVRDQIRQDAEAGAPRYDGAPSSGISYARPNLILNRERLNRVERKLALKLIYASDATDPEEGEDESSALYRHYKLEAESAWRAIGPLKYDAAEDLAPDVTIRDAGRVVRTRRAQA